jgi:flavorubredoxin
MTDNGKISAKISWVGAVDWDRRLFDSLIPLPDGTSYNAYVLEGSERTVLLDTVDPPFAGRLMERLAAFPRIDYVVAHHAEQDHSGSIPRVLERFPAAIVLASPKCTGMLTDHLLIPPGRIRAVADGESVSLGDRTLTFLHTPWVHWPETMCTWVPEEKVLFSCDFFGAHLAASDLFVTDEGALHESAKRYFAEIMMPFRNAIRSNLEKVKALPVETIAPSHGPVHRRPSFIMEAYREWASETPKNEVVIPYVSMHGSTAALVDALMDALSRRGITVRQFNMAGADIGKLAIALVDAATIVIGTPTVLFGPHPNAAYALILANALRPKAKFASLVGSYAWGTKIAEQVVAMLPNLKVEVLPPVICKGYPKEADFAAIETLADAIETHHKEAGLTP